MPTFPPVAPQAVRQSGRAAVSGALAAAIVLCGPVASYAADEPAPTIPDLPAEAVPASTPAEGLEEDRARVPALPLAGPAMATAGAAPAVDAPAPSVPEGLAAPPEETSATSTARTTGPPMLELVAVPDRAPLTALAPQVAPPLTAAASGKTLTDTGRTVEPTAIIGTAALPTRDAAPALLALLAGGLLGISRLLGDRPGRTAEAGPGTSVRPPDLS